MGEIVKRMLKLPGSSNHKVIIMFAGDPPFRKIQRQLSMLLQLLLEIRVGNYLFPQLGLEVHSLQNLASLLLSNVVH